MATSVSFNGVTYSIPANREPRGWGTSLSAFLVDVANSALSKAGGTFTLTADANFGATYGLVLKYIKSASSNISSTGVVRFANNEGLGWRNAANGADKILKVNASDRLDFDGTALPLTTTANTWAVAQAFSGLISANNNSTIGIEVNNSGGTSPNIDFKSAGVRVGLVGFDTSNNFNVTNAGGSTNILRVSSTGAITSSHTFTGTLVFPSGQALIAPVLGTPTSGVATNLTGLPLTTGVTGTLPVTNGGTGVTTSTGSGNNVLSTSPTLVTPLLGTPTSATLTNATGLPLTTGVTGTLPVANGGTGVTSSTGSGNNVLSTSPTLVTPVLGVATATSIAANAHIFPATQVSAADPNTLDDYEEGTWTPTFTSTAATFAYTVNSGSYTKIGNRVMWSCTIQLSGAPTGTLTNAITLSLPIAAVNATARRGGGFVTYCDTSFVPTSLNVINTTDLAFYSPAGVAATPTTLGFSGSARFLYLTGSYEAAT